MESGSFTAAAEQLGLSKQFVSSRQIQLEDRLGRLLRCVLPQGANHPSHGQERLDGSL
ncbi:helix-turn-helix domain-containing protein [Klebsiella pneumoniae]|uniref:helix-turn-helix domain-containing protein n=1 Tax=Klebsiella pneumoniae TaxID=573 RepID=UPI00351E21D7